MVLAGFAVVFAVLGLTPGLSWIPEAPLLVLATVVPIGILFWTGTRASQSSRPQAGFLAGSVAGSMGGLAGGLAYLAYGKPALNVVLGAILGAVVGALVGTSGGLWHRSGGKRPRS